MNSRRNRHPNQSSHSNKGLIITFGTIMILLLVVLIIVMVGMNASNANKPVKTVRTTTTRTVAKKAPTVKAQPNALSQLAVFSQNSVEDPSTRTNGGDVTYSQFYLNSKTHRWFWSFSSSKRGQVENARVTHVQRSGRIYQINMVSLRYEPGTHYQVTVEWLNRQHTRYNLHTTFKSINGDYVLGTAAYTDYTQVHNTSTTTDIDDWLEGNVEGIGQELAETVTNNGDVTDSQFYKADGTWYWILDTEKRGDIVEAQITSGTVSSDGNSAQLNAVNIQYPYYHTHFTLNVNMLNSGNEYSAQTGFQTIYGKYKLMDD